jgi:hypothetical protein
LQVAFEQAEPARIGILARGNSERGLEAPLQVEWTLVKDIAETREGNWLVKMLLEVAADFFRGIRLRIAAD